MSKKQDEDLEFLLQKVKEQGKIINHLKREIRQLEKELKKTPNNDFFVDIKEDIVYSGDCSCGNVLTYINLGLKKATLIICKKCGFEKVRPDS